MKRFNNIVFFSLFFAFSSRCLSQNPSGLLTAGNTNNIFSCIGFWNVENLYDTIDDPLTIDEEFLPGGANQWNSERYFQKLNNLSDVISKMGSEISTEGPAILGLAEIENREVLDDLVKTEKLKPFNYQIVHHHSPDKRGVDVALIYQPRFFKISSSRSYSLKMENDTGFFTRDQLLVSGIFDGKPLHILVNHWPSRRGGEKESAPKRISAATLSRTILDSLLSADAEAGIILMGDFNDDPLNESVKNYLKTQGNIGELKKGEFYNPMEELFNKGTGTLAWKNIWNLFDQVMLSNSLVKNNIHSFHFFDAKVFDKPFLKQQEGNFSGTPFRTYAGKKYLGGYSDHFPVYIILSREKL